jgi:PIN domain nuclease of toxin-antitoxin system
MWSKILKTLLDTHILLWWFEAGDRLSLAQRQVLESVSPDSPLCISDISLWEIATLFRLGRIRLRFPLRDWLVKASSPPLVRRVGINPAVAAEVAALPESFHRDLADRIVVATARVLGAQLLTQDQRIIHSKLVSTIE